MKPTMACALVVIAGVLAAGATARAQDAAYLPAGGDVRVAAPGGEDWGTTTNVVETYEASDFEIASGVYGGFDINGARFCGNNAPCSWFAGVRLPTGALISHIELDACDTDPASQVSFGLLRNVKGGGVTTNLNGSLASTGGTPGCNVFAATLTAPETVNNLNNNYFLDVVSGPNNLTKFKAIRIFYRLQVSGAPAVATFPNDVPITHPFFKFVEALARAGITGGCAADSFCPDDPVTRGQMAVFLATALGMHFAN